jgi:hypothetical protein
VDLLQAPYDLVDGPEVLPLGVDERLNVVRDEILRVDQRERPVEVRPRHVQQGLDERRRQTSEIGGCVEEAENVGQIARFEATSVSIGVLVPKVAADAALGELCKKCGLEVIAVDGRQRREIVEINITNKQVVRRDGR